MEGGREPRKCLHCTCKQSVPHCTMHPSRHVGTQSRHVGTLARMYEHRARAQCTRHVHMHVHQMCMSPMMSTPPSRQITDVSSHLVCPPQQSAETEHPGPGRREPATTRRMGTTQTTQPPAPHPDRDISIMYTCSLHSVIRFCTFARARATLACHSKAATHHGKLATHTRHKHARRAWPFLMSDTAAVYIRDHIV